MRLLNYVLCRRDERISVEIEARDRSRIGDSASISQRRDRPRGAVAGRMTFFNSLLWGSLRDAHRLRRASFLSDALDRVGWAENYLGIACINRDGGVRIEVPLTANPAS